MLGTLFGLWGAYALWHPDPLLRAWWQRLRLLRWFFAALLLIFFSSAWQAPAAARPEILLLGLRQILVLLTLMLAVTCVLEPLNVAQRIAALTRLLAPLGWLGLDVGRVARMLAWALADALHFRQELQQADGDRVQSSPMDRLARLCLELERRQPPSFVPGPITRGPHWAWVSTAPLLLLLGAPWVALAGS